MGFIKGVLDAKRNTIDRLENERAEYLLAALRGLGAEVSADDVVFYGAKEYDDHHDQPEGTAAVDMPYLLSSLPKGIMAEEVRVPVILVEGLLFAACQVEVRRHNGYATSREPQGLGLYLMSYQPCQRRLLGLHDEYPHAIYSREVLATRLKDVVGRSFHCKSCTGYDHKGIVKDVYHPYQVDALPTPIR